MLNVKQVFKLINVYKNKYKPQQALLVDKYYEHLTVSMKI